MELGAAVAAYVRKLRAPGAAGELQQPRRELSLAGEFIQILWRGGFEALAWNTWTDWTDLDRFADDPMPASQTHQPKI